MHSYFFCFCFTNWGRICNFFLLLFSFGIFWVSQRKIYTPVKVLNDYHNLVHADEKVRVQVITAVFEHISNTNRKRTVRLEPPMDHKEIEDELKICLRENGLSENPPTFMDGRIPKLQSGQLALANLQANLPGSQKGNGKNGGKKPAAATSRRQLALIKSPSGNLVCFNWNNSTCTRPRTQEGCKDAASGKEYAHLCLAPHANGLAHGHCLMRHARKDHR